MSEPSVHTHTVHPASSNEDAVDFAQKSLMIQWDNASSTGSGGKTVASLNASEQGSVSWMLVSTFFRLAH